MMTMKFKVGFTMSAETLFGIIAKFLPVEDLHVEEVPEILPKIGKVERLAGPENRLQPPHPKRNRYNGPSLEGGVNAAILKVLEDGKPHRYRDLQAATAAAGYSRSGIGSRLARLRELKIVHQPDFGRWQVGEAPAAKKTA